jgi:hypothetical protein
MRKFLVLVVMSGVLGFIAPGCGVSTSEEVTLEPQSSEYGFTRDSSGRAVPSETVALDEFSALESFDRSPGVKDLQSATEIEGGVGSCSGACNANVCVCSGDLQCCIVGCGLCFELAN